MQLDEVFTAEDRKMRLPWWGVLCLMIGAAPLLFLFYKLGRPVLALPTLDSAAMLGIAIALRWKLRRHVWFWLTMAAFAAFHILLILLVPWTDKWVPAPVIIPFGLADVYVMLAIVAVVGNLVGRQKSSTNAS
jgi:hypothetical protein